MLSPDSLALGTMMILLSGVLSVVVKTWISSTTPATPAPSIKSPTLNGRKMIIRKPAAKFASEPCKARPIARPAAPKMAMNEVVWIPSWPSATTTKASKAM